MGGSASEFHLNDSEFFSTPTPFSKIISFSECLFFFFQIIYLFIFGGSGSSVLLMGFLKGGAQASHCRGFSCGAWSNY